MTINFNSPNFKGINLNYLKQAKKTSKETGDINPMIVNDIVQDCLTTKKLSICDGIDTLTAIKNYTNDEDIAELIDEAKCGLIHLEVLDKLGNFFSGKH